MAIRAPIMGTRPSATTFYPSRAPRVRRLLSALSRAEIGDAIEALVARLDALDGDTDLEDGDVDCCPAKDDCGPHAALFQFGAGDGYPGNLVDAEDDDPREDDGEDRCLAGDDGCGADEAGVSLFDLLLWSRG